MKKIIFAATLLTSLSSFAQVNNGNQVCEAIRIVTSYPERVTECMQIVRGQKYSHDLVKLLKDFTRTSTSEVNKILRFTANGDFQHDALKVCSTVKDVTSYPDRVTRCLETIQNGFIIPKAATLAQNVAYTSTLEANNILAAAMNANFPVAGLAVCESIRSITSYPDRITECVKILKEKSISSHDAQMCSNIAKTNSNEALNCLRTSVTDYSAPVPTPTRDIIISADQINILKMDLMKAKSQIERGLTTQAAQTLEDALSIVKDIERK